MWLYIYLYIKTYVNKCRGKWRGENEDTNILVQIDHIFSLSWTLGAEFRWAFATPTWVVQTTRSTACAFADVGWGHETHRSPKKVTKSQPGVPNGVANGTWLVLVAPQNKDFPKAFLLVKMTCGRWFPAHGRVAGIQSPKRMSFVSWSLLGIQRQQNSFTKTMIFRLSLGLPHCHA